MLTEKYKPKTLQGVIGQDLSNLKRFILEKAEWKKNYWPKSYCPECCKKYFNKKD